MPILSLSRQVQATLVIAAGLSAACDAGITANPDRCNLLVASVTPPSASIGVADTLRLTAAYLPVAAECIPSVPASSLVWRSSSPGVVAVDSQSGLATAVAPGDAQVIAGAPSKDRVLGFLFIQVHP